mmetsp:Transcript_10647/g.11736  ORF Transcript_10647/g.11736 Transcript_10647/m.11736 type:complete len:216 (-) Transcript_10647:105-752(-)|eukprot:Skav222097  [mRNA]  locus=scaffold2165:282656:288930:- [translate_table: standard]
MAAMAKAFAKDSISGSTATTPPSRSGPGSLPSTEYEDVSSFSALSARAPEDRTEPMTGNFRRRRYYIPEEHSDSFKATVASPIRDSTTRCERRPREHIMQVKIEGLMQKRSFGLLWTSYWVVLDQSAVRFYESEQASISRPDAPVEEIPAHRLVPEIPRNHPTWVICTDDWTKQKVLYLRSGCEPPTWEDVASARLWYWALGERGTDCLGCSSSQ